MSKSKENKTYTLDSVIDEVIGKVGTPKRDEFEKRITTEIQKGAKLS
ncbi:hypothetical protein [Myroides sp. WP-1]|nr:hypothetical protein [Myroides sp. WP-1]MBB1140969.1 hypothetical protein [Myroides sp. WP-1]